MDINRYAMELAEKVRNKEMTWEAAANLLGKTTGIQKSADAMRKYCNRISKNSTLNSDSSISEQKVLNYNPDMTDKNKLLQDFGYDPLEWEFVYVSKSEWQSFNGEMLYAVKYRVKPRENAPDSISLIDYAKECLEKLPVAKPIIAKIEKVDNKKLMELPGMELHLGKFGWEGDTGKASSSDILVNRFRTIMQEVADLQEKEKCNSCVLYIGNDFFNSDTVMNTTTRGTQQFNDLSWKQMFKLGLNLYAEWINDLAKRFNKLYVYPVPGNHDRMSSWYLYITLSNYFRTNKNIEFSNSERECQVFVWGDCAIFSHHGDSNRKRLLKSIAVEYPREWGNAKYRELHLGHLHKEETITDDSGGMITRILGAPTETDIWHYQERFLGATQKYQVFVWHKEKGLRNINYINF